MDEDEGEPVGRRAVRVRVVVVQGVVVYVGVGHVLAGFGLVGINWD